MKKPIKKFRKKPKIIITHEMVEIATKEFFKNGGKINKQYIDENKIADFYDTREVDSFLRGE